MHSISFIRAILTLTGFCWTINADVNYNEHHLHKRADTDTSLHADDDVQRIQQNLRLDTLRGLSRLEPDQQKPIIKDVMLDRMVNRVFDDKPHNHALNYMKAQGADYRSNHWQPNRVLIEGDLNEQIYKTLESHHALLASTLHRTLHRHVSDHPLLSAEQKRAVRARLDRTLDRNEMTDVVNMHHPDGAGYAYDQLAEPLTQMHSHALMHGIWDVHKAHHHPEPFHEARADLLHRARQHVEAIDRHPKLGMQVMQQRLQGTMQTGMGRENHERTAAKIGAAYASAFYPVTKARHFPDENWNLLPGGTGGVHPPEFMKEGYRAPTEHRQESSMDEGWRRRVKTDRDPDSVVQSLRGSRLE